ncbi:hypothetical protein [Nocardioides sp. Leaf307]|uniref:hypothetical protein n=1 Tax=Nocardioides sp. Leaf307 TaxID=1736331 RepID=UPI000703AC70|nr:hypothetical protein [Nocardioides sp. Leaf307]KQQ42940.1 hypothetical protein ASF50_02695 [Nocardioides sp. Leaf307]
MYHAYGMTVDRLRARAGLVGPRELEWIPLGLELATGPAPAESGLRWEDHRVELRSAGVATIAVHREQSGDSGVRASIMAPSPVSEAEVHHPYLAFIAGVASRWMGRTTLHGAAVVLGGRSWVLTGGPGSGKSSLAAALDRCGHAVQSDDLAVIEAGTVFAGPRGADLRDDSAATMGRGELVRRGEEARWRTVLSPAPHEAPLGGLVELRWGDRLLAEKVPLSRRLDVLARAEGFGRGPSRDSSFLELLSRPVWTLTRPRRWDSTDEAVDVLDGLASGG